MGNKRGYYLNVNVSKFIFFWEYYFGIFMGEGNVKNKDNDDYFIEFLVNFDIFIVGYFIRSSYF